MIFERTLVYSSYTPYSIYFRMAIQVRNILQEPHHSISPSSCRPKELGGSRPFETFLEPYGFSKRRERRSLRVVPAVVLAMRKSVLSPVYLSLSLSVYIR